MTHADLHVPMSLAGRVVGHAPDAFGSCVTTPEPSVGSFDGRSRSISTDFEAERDSSNSAMPGVLGVLVVTLSDQVLLDVHRALNQVTDKQGPLVLHASSPNQLPASLATIRQGRQPLHIVLLEAELATSLAAPLKQLGVMVVLLGGSAQQAQALRCDGALEGPTATSQLSIPGLATFLYLCRLRTVSNASAASSNASVLSTAGSPLPAMNSGSLALQQAQARLLALQLQLLQPTGKDGLAKGTAALDAPPPSTPPSAVQPHLAAGATQATGQATPALEGQAAARSTRAATDALPRNSEELLRHEVNWLLQQQVQQQQQQGQQAAAAPVVATAAAAGAAPHASPSLQALIAQVEELKKVKAAGKQAGVAADGVLAPTSIPTTPSKAEVPLTGQAAGASRSDDPREPRLESGHNPGESSDLLELPAMPPEGTLPLRGLQLGPELSVHTPGLADGQTDASLSLNSGDLAIIPEPGMEEAVSLSSATDKGLAPPTAGLGPGGVQGGKVQMVEAAAEGASAGNGVHEPAEQQPALDPLPEVRLTAAAQEGVSDSIDQEDGSASADQEHASLSADQEGVSASIDQEGTVADDQSNKPITDEIDSSTVSTINAPEDVSMGIVSSAALTNGFMEGGLGPDSRASGAPDSTDVVAGAEQGAGAPSEVAKVVALKAEGDDMASRGGEVVEAASRTAAEVAVAPGQAGGEGAVSGGPQTETLQVAAADDGGRAAPGQADGDDAVARSTQEGKEDEQAAAEVAVAGAPELAAGDDGEEDVGEIREQQGKVPDAAAADSAAVPEQAAGEAAEGEISSQEGEDTGAAAAESAADQMPKSGGDADREAAIAAAARELERVMALPGGFGGPAFQAAMLKLQQASAGLGGVDGTPTEVGDGRVELEEVVGRAGEGVAGFQGDVEGGGEAGGEVARGAGGVSETEGAPDGPAVPAAGAELLVAAAEAEAGGKVLVLEEPCVLYVAEGERPTAVLDTEAVPVPEAPSDEAVKGDLEQALDTTESESEMGTANQMAALDEEGAIEEASQASEATRSSVCDEDLGGLNGGVLDDAAAERVSDSCGDDATIRGAEAGVKGVEVLQQGGDGVQGEEALEGEGADDGAKVGEVAVGAIDGVRGGEGAEGTEDGVKGLEGVDDGEQNLEALKQAENGLQEVEVVEEGAQDGAQGSEPCPEEEQSKDSTSAAASFEAGVPTVGAEAAKGGLDGAGRHSLEVASAAQQLDLLLADDQATQADIQAAMAKLQQASAWQLQQAEEAWRRRSMDILGLTAGGHRPTGGATGPEPVFADAYEQRDDQLASLVQSDWSTSSLFASTGGGPPAEAEVEGNQDVGVRDGADRPERVQEAPQVQEPGGVASDGADGLVGPGEASLAVGEGAAVHTDMLEEELQDFHATVARLRASIDIQPMKSPSAGEHMLLWPQVVASEARHSMGELSWSSLKHLQEGKGVRASLDSHPVLFGSDEAKLST